MESVGLMASGVRARRQPSFAVGIRRIAAIAAVLMALLAPSGRADSTARADRDDLAIEALMQQIAHVARSGDRAGWNALLASSANRRDAGAFADAELRPGVTQVVIKTRDRAPLDDRRPGAGSTIVADAFFAYGDRARVSSWQLDVTPADDGTWRIARAVALSSLDPIYRLSLDAAHQYDVSDFVVSADDLEITLARGSVYTVAIDRGITGLVLVGRGRMRFHPAPETERGQVRILTGADTVTSTFQAAFVRVGTLGAHVDPATLVPHAVQPEILKRADAVFRDEAPKSLLVDLGDLSSDRWWSLPGPDDFLAEVRTDRYGTLTYTRAADQPEDIAFFDRRRQHNIALYASKATLAARGPFYDEDALAPYDVQHYDVDLAISPNTQQLDGLVRLTLRVRASSVEQLSVKLADSLAVQSVTSDRFGRLFAVRIPGQNALLVNLPATVVHGTELTLTFAYGGRLAPQAPNRETIAPAQDEPPPPRRPPSLDELRPRLEPSFLYSSQVDWYPHPPIPDYATATLRISVPDPYVCVASGQMPPHPPRRIADADGSNSRKLYEVSAVHPLRYLSFVVSRFQRLDHRTITFDSTTVSGGASTAAPLDLTVLSNVAQTPIDGRAIADRTSDIVTFYRAIVDDAPYPSLTLALLEDLRPGGHSPAYFAVLQHPIEDSGLTWRTDPVAFSDYPEFFLAHEIAHQWWGQAVAGRNYHEQWISEGLAQYFAALYAQHLRGDAVFASVMRQMRRSAIEHSSDGPIYLGYRVGHIRDDSRAFRAVIYNKSAAVLHMLRRLVGDEAFFDGLRHFYADGRFQKTSTDRLRMAMEAASGRSLDRFFDRWFYASTLPSVALRYHVEMKDGARALALRFDQTGDVFDLPVTVVLTFADHAPETVTIPITARTVERDIPLSGTLRTVDVSKDDGTLADVVITRSGR
jgi:hypothetical protein